MKIQLTSLFLVSLFNTTLLSASSPPSLFPPGCKASGFSYAGDNLVLNESGSQTLYLIQNRNKDIIQLQNEENKNAFMNPPLLAVMKPDKWSAFACDIANFRFKCYKKNGDNIVSVSCMDVLEVCQYPRVEFAVSNKGNYWASINKDKRAAIEEAAGKGIFLHW